MIEFFGTYRAKTDFEKIKESDLFVTDKGNHRIIGLKYKRQHDVCPKVSFISSPQISELKRSKNLIFKFGKPMYCRENFSARLYRRYCAGDTLDYEDWDDAANIYALFL